MLGAGVPIAPPWSWQEGSSPGTWRSLGMKSMCKHEIVLLALLPCATFILRHLLLHFNSYLHHPKEAEVLWLHPSLNHSHVNIFNRPICLKMNSIYLF